MEVLSLNSTCLNYMFITPKKDDIIMFFMFVKKNSYFFGCYDAGIASVKTSCLLITLIRVLLQFIFQT